MTKKITTQRTQTFIIKTNSKFYVSIFVFFVCFFFQPHQIKHFNALMKMLQIVVLCRFLLFTFLIINLYDFLMSLSFCCLLLLCTRLKGIMTCEFQSEKIYITVNQVS